MQRTSNLLETELLGDRASTERIVEQTLRALFFRESIEAEYLPKEAERVFRRLTGFSDHPRKLGRHLTKLASRSCTAVKTACGTCAMQSFCVTGRMRITRQAQGPKFVDLFSGAGGFSLGFESLGYTSALAVDNDATAIRTYRFNRPSNNGRVIVGDVRELAADHSLRCVAPLLIGGPPCQTFSNANRQRNSADLRDGLVDVFFEAVRTIRPSVFVMENVLGARGRAEQVRLLAEKAGYWTAAEELDAADFGVPQRRRRMFLFGVRVRGAAGRADVARAFLNALKRETPLPQTLLREAIDDLPRVRVPDKPNSTTADSADVGFIVGPPSTLRGSEYVQRLNGGRQHQFLYNHRAKYLNERDREIYGLLRPGEKSDSPDIAHIMPYARRAHIFRDKFYRLRSDELCKTITAHMYYDCHMYVHPRQARGLTPREAARIQGFPDDYLFLGRPNEWYRQIGNAVSPNVALEVGKIASALLSVIGEEIPT